MLGLDALPAGPAVHDRSRDWPGGELPNHHDQSERIKAHASSIVAVVAMVFAAAVLLACSKGPGT